MRMTRRRAIGNHRNRLTRSMAWRVHDFHVKDRGKPAKTLRADTQRVDLVKNLNAHRLNIILWTACF